MSSKSKKILFICLGNICRSPLAEAIFKKKAKERGLEKMWLADSCGTANYHVGSSPDPRTLSNAEKNGVTIEHVGRQLRASDFGEFNLLLVMDDSNLKNTLRLPTAQQFRDRIKLLRSFDTVGVNEPVPDPYYGTENNFQNVFEILDRVIGCLLDELQKG